MKHEQFTRQQLEAGVRTRTSFVVPAITLLKILNRMEGLKGTLRDVAIPTLKHCEDKYGIDDHARANCEAALVRDWSSAAGNYSPMNQGSQTDVLGGDDLQ